VLVNFWTWTCINWLRQEPHVRGWSQAYRDDGLVVIGVHTPEFSFEHEIDGVRQETRQRAIDYPVAEDAITRGLDCWLAALFDDDHIDLTCELLAGASEPDDATEPRVARLRSQITDCDRRLDGYRSVIDNGGDVSVVAKWIGETQRERKTLLAQLNSPLHSEKLTTDEIGALVETLRDIVATLGEADPADKTGMPRGPINHLSEVVSGRNARRQPLG
jgi:hypothetical protein